MTLALAEPAQSCFEAQRRRHFPPALNFIPAHITLFHHLPGQELAAIGQALQTAGAETPVFPVQIVQPMLLGRGVAWRLQSQPLSALRDRLAALWSDWLTPQDRQPYRPHLTIQNKATPADARALHADLQQNHTPYAADAAALQLWHYRGGPWDPAGTFRFSAARPAPSETAG